MFLVNVLKIQPILFQSKGLLSSLAANPKLAKLRLLKFDIIGDKNTLDARIKRNSFFQFSLWNFNGCVPEEGDKKFLPLSLLFADFQSYLA